MLFGWVETVAYLSARPGGREIPKTLQGCALQGGKRFAHLAGAMIWLLLGLGFLVASEHATAGAMFAMPHIWPGLERLLDASGLRTEAWAVPWRRGRVGLGGASR